MLSLDFSDDKNLLCVVCALLTRAACTRLNAQITITTFKYSVFDGEILILLKLELLRRQKHHQSTVWGHFPFIVMDIYVDSHFRDQNKE